MLARAARRIRSRGEFLRKAKAGLSLLRMRPGERVYASRGGQAEGQRLSS